jgi:hypothetical protein
MRSCRLNVAKATPRVMRRVPVVLGSPLSFNLSRPKKLAAVQNLSEACTTHCTLHIQLSRACQLFLIQLHSYRSSQPVPVSSIIYASPALQGYFIDSLLPLQTIIHRPLLILSCRHELLIYPSRSSRLSSGGGIPSRIRCLHIERRARICTCLSLLVETTLSSGRTARPTTTISTQRN